LTAATVAGALLALAGTLLTADPAGRLLLAGATLVLAAYSAVDLLFWPRVCADADGVVVRAPFESAVLRWDQIEGISADVRERLGIRSTTLEIDAGDRLLVFSRRALGADPAHVADVLRAFDPR